MAVLGTVLKLGNMLAALNSYAFVFWNISELNIWNVYAGLV